MESETRKRATAARHAGFALAILDGIERQTASHMALLRAHASDEELAVSRHALAILNRAYDAYTDEDV